MVSSLDLNSIWFESYAAEKTVLQNTYIMLWATVSVNESYFKTDAVFFC